MARNNCWGGGSYQALPAQELLKQVRQLRSRKKIRSAVALVQIHKRTARQVLLQPPAQFDDPALELIAAALDEGMPSTIWGTLQAEYRTRPDAKNWPTLAATLAAANDLAAVEKTIAELSEIADRFESPLLRIELLRLTGDVQIATGQTAQAIESLVSAAELAARRGAPSLAADLWLMSCEASLRLDQIQQSRQCWKAAVDCQLASMHARGEAQLLPTIDSVFWEQAVRLNHPGNVLPKELTVALAPWYSRIGIQIDETLTPEAALWSAVAEYQLATGQPHLASLSIKRAETNATDQERPYLQIALARAMAAQGQHAVATTILGTVAESEEPNVRASALAVLGSIKIQSGAYEQGSRFLGQALAIEDAKEWPGRLAAQADFANVHLILGELDDALPALHAVQTEMLTRKKWQSLCHSLENEAAILELDGRKKEAKLIRKRIDKIESREL